MPADSSMAGDWPPDAVDVATPTEATRTDSGGPDRDDGADLSLDLTFELLKNARRRVALRYLDEHSSTTLSTLAEHVAALENDKPVSQLSSAERKRVYISLYQCHLPKLDDAGVIDFDSNRGTVERNQLADHFALYLQNVAASANGNHGPDWHRYYLGIGLAGGSVLAVQVAVLPSLVATTAITLTLVAAFVSLALVQTRARAGLL